MSDGSTFTFQGDWSAISDRVLFGNDGPVFPGIGLARHYVDRCTTINAQDHQKDVYAYMTGTLNGEPVHTYPGNLGFDYIAYTLFHIIDVTHGDC